MTQLSAQGRTGPSPFESLLNLSHVVARLQLVRQEPIRIMEIYLEVDSLDIAYAAGLFDGEGCVHLDNRGNLSVIIANNNFDVLSWCQDRWEGGLYKTKPGHYQWRVNSDEAVFFLEDVVDRLIVKKDQARVALTLFG